MFDFFKLKKNKTNQLLDEIENPAALITTDELESRIDKTKYRIVQNGELFAFKRYAPFRLDDANWTSGKAGRGEFKPDPENQENWCLHTSNASKNKREIIQLILDLQESDEKTESLKSQKWKEVEESCFKEEGVN